MSIGKVEGGRYLAQCRKCGKWHEVWPSVYGSETYFAYQEAAFSCCGLDQRVLFVIEKDELDFH